MIYKQQDPFCRGTIGSYNGSTRVARFVDFRQEVEFSCPWKMWGQKILDFMINQPSTEKLIHYFLYLHSIFCCQIRWKFAVVDGITQLSHGFLYVIFLLYLSVSVSVSLSLSLSVSLSVSLCHSQSLSVSLSLSLSVSLSLSLSVSLSLFLSLSLSLSVTLSLSLSLCLYLCLSVSVSLSLCLSVSLSLSLPLPPPLWLYKTSKCRIFGGIKRLLGMSLYSEPALQCPLEIDAALDHTPVSFCLYLSTSCFKY